MDSAHKGISAAEIAASAGLPATRYIQLEKGLEIAEPHEIARLAIALCVSTDYLLGLDPDSEGADAGIRNWLLNSAALQAANRAELAKRLAKAEGEKEQLRDAIAELVACTTDLVAALNRVVDSNKETFEDLKKGSALVAAGDAAQQANALALFFL